MGTNPIMVELQENANYMDSHLGKNYNQGLLYLEILDGTVDEACLYNTFKQFGKIIFAKVIAKDHQSGSDGYISFSAMAEATTAKVVMYGKMLGQKPIYVYYAFGPGELASGQTHSQRQEPSTSTMLAAEPPQKQKLVERLFLSIKCMYPELAGKITGTLLGMHNLELFDMLDHNESLQAKVAEAIAVLQASQAVSLNKPIVKIQRHESFTATRSADLQQEQKQLLLEHLFPLIERMCPHLAREITNMLSETHNTQLLDILIHKESLKAKVEEAMAVLQARQTAKIQKQSVQGQEPLTATMLAAIPSHKQKQMLRASLFPLVEQMCPELASKITDMLLGLQQIELLDMLEHNESLKGKVEEAIAVLQARQAATMKTREQEYFSATMLAVESQQEHKQLLLEHLFPLIQRMYPALATTITSMLMTTHNSELLDMVEHSDSLQAKVKGVVAVLRACEVRRSLQAATMNALRQQHYSGHRLAAGPVQDQRRLLREYLFYLVHRMYPQHAGIITNMFFGMDQLEFLHMLEHNEILKANVEEAVAVLQSKKGKF